MDELWLALALVLVLEGMLPFLSPSAYRGVVQIIAEIDDRWLRIIGLIAMLAGLALLYFVK